MKLLFALFLSSFSCKQPQWFSNFEEAKKKASENHKLLLINFSGSDWCEACNAWGAKVFGTDTFKSIAEKNLILVNSDYPRDKKYLLPYNLQQQYNSLMKKYNPHLQFPFTVLIDQNGNKLGEWALSQIFTPEKFINDINQTVSTYSITWQVKQ